MGNYVLDHKEKYIMSKEEFLKLLNCSPEEKKKRKSGNNIKNNRWIGIKKL